MILTPEQRVACTARSLLAAQSAQRISVAIKTIRNLEYLAESERRHGESDSETQQAIQEWKQNLEALRCISRGES